MDEPVKISLSQPVTAHGETVTELTFRPPTGRDLREAGRSTLANGELDGMWEYRLCASCCGIPPSTIDAMPMRDAAAILRAMRGFFREPTPSTSSAPISDAPGSGAAASETSGI